MAEINQEWAEFGERYAQAQKENGWDSYYDYLAWLTAHLAVQDFEPSTDDILKPPVRTGMHFCPVADPTSSGNDSITAMEQAFPVLLACVGEAPQLHVDKLAVPRHAFWRHPIG